MQTDIKGALPNFIKRDGSVVPFSVDKIRRAIQNAFLDVFKGENGERMRSVVDTTTESVVAGVLRNSAATVHVEDVQDQVELALLRAGHVELARGYMVYREQHAAKRREQEKTSGAKSGPLLNIDGVEQRFDAEQLLAELRELCAGVDVDLRPVVDQVQKELFDGATRRDLNRALALATRAFIEDDPLYDVALVRIELRGLYSEVLGTSLGAAECGEALREAFPRLIKAGVAAELLNPTLQEFDLAKLAAALKVERDLQLDYLGFQTLYDRYFQHVGGKRIELPQTFFMRVAMGLALNEIDRETRAIEFYEVLSSFDFMTSTPTLFNSGTRHSQLSSCFLTTVSDDLDGIYEALKENALLSKYAGGLGNDWTPVRALGSHIKGTNGKSQGVVPFLKVVNDTAVAVNQGGKRKGAVCAYLESWHLDIEEFLDLRKNTGDDRRRTQDMNTANWIPDLFMKRVIEGGQWTLFSPSTCPDLHDLFGAAFDKAYAEYEAKADRGEIKLFKRMPAKDLWRKMLSMLFETGHPWITFKDACNVRSPQQHVGVVHSSNLCTEITLNTNDSEIAVCNLGSVNLAQHLKDGQIDQAKLKKTVRTAMRMLDNVIDINYYAVKKARDSNMRHRPVGLGIMGFQDALYQLRTPYASQAAVEFADRSMEAVCYYAYWASTELAEERGRYSSYKGSLWDRGILPIDSLDLLAEARGGYVDVDRSTSMDWDALRARIATHGMRNSNCVAIAPTATISNIIGVDASIEPCFGNLSVKSNMGGEFTVLNGYLVRDLKAIGLWDRAMVADLKHFDGSLRRIERVPEEIRALYATAFEVDPSWLIEAAARRQKWIDQAQSLNIYMAGASGKKLDETYKLAWQRGLKTTYYLRTVSATQVEKSTVTRSGQLNAVAAATAPEAALPATDVKFCALDDPGCQSCQ